METPATPASAQPQTPQPSSWTLLGEIRSWARDLAIALGLAIVIIVFLYQPVKVEGTSMVPSLTDQERIFINKYVYRLEPIERGDVVVFWYPLDRSKSFIKRVIALPGETIEIKQGHVYVNGQLLAEAYVKSAFADTGSYGPVKVPEGQYYVMGDHRASSNDSRVFGTVPMQFIYGKAVFVYWPLERFGALPTTDQQ